MQASSSFAGWLGDSGHQTCAATRRNLPALQEQVCIFAGPNPQGQQSKGTPVLGQLMLQLFLLVAKSRVNIKQNVDAFHSWWVKVWVYHTFHIFCFSFVYF